MFRRTLFTLAAAAAVAMIFGPGSAQAGLIAGVDFQAGTDGSRSFDATPDDLDTSDGISVSGWTGDIRWDDGANGDTA